MNVIKKLAVITILIFMTSTTSHARITLTPRTNYDIIIAGAGTGGISAAIQAAKMGASVLVVEPSSMIGGQAIAAGVSTVDDKSRQMSGIYLDFYNRLKNYYDSRGKSMGTCYWTSQTVAFEPRIGHEILMDMINDASRRNNLDLLLNSEIISLKIGNKSISGVSVKTQSGKRDYTCKVLIDATEYGDMLPLARINYRVGNSEAKFYNPEAMIQDITWTAVIRKYPSGVPAYLRPLYPLPGYELAKRNYEAFVSKDGANFRNVFPIETPVNFLTHNAYRGLPDSSNPYNYNADAQNRVYITKTSINWGNDYPGTYSWEGKRGLPAAYLEDKNFRLQIEREALIKTLNFIYYMQNELGEDWSVADDEYYNQVLPEAAKTLPYEWQEIARRMPPIPYVRESRRIINKNFTLTSHELLQNSLSYRDGRTSHEFYDAIAIGGYILDLHGATRDADMEWDFNEREQSMITNRPRGPFQVPMRILIPDGIDGLIAAEKNLSMTRLTSGALRLQPITMMTGQAAGALAALSARDNKAPRFIHPMRVQWELLNSGVNLSLCKYSDVPPEHELNKTIQISNMYGFLPAKEYPHAPSYNIEDRDDPVLAMALIRGHDKGVFGLEELITRREAKEIINKAQKILAVSSQDNKTGINNKLDNFITRGDFIKAICEAFPRISEAPAPKRYRVPFKTGSHRNSEYVNILAKLGILDIYRNEREFHYGRPVTKAEAADIIVKSCIIISALH